MLNFFKKFLDINEREIDKLQIIVDNINSLELKFKKLKKEDFEAKTTSLKKQLAQGKTLEEVLPEAFALAREASLKTIGKRHYDVQLMAAVALFQGKIAEQKTGEGKTLTAVPALYLHALRGKGVHLVTVNDFLARLHAGWNGPIFNSLGLTVGVIIHDQSFLYDPKHVDNSHGDERLAHLKPVSRKEAYLADITYGTNNEFGFDYLRDNMVGSLEEVSQRGHYFAIVDEVDSILIDEARTPLIISTPDTEPTDKYYQFSKIVENLAKESDYKIDEKLKTVTLTDLGIKRVERLLGIDNLYEKDFETIHHVENALKAKTLFIKDKDYIVKEDEVIIVDEFTGRLMPGRRWSEGLHQAVEAKENVKIQQESRTLATISFQNYFRMYERLSGMTGTATTESEEFHKIYDLEVVAVPTHRAMVRKDNADVVYKTATAKYAAIVNEVDELHKKGQPILIGTTSIEKNEIISAFLKRKGVPHQVLNAKHHEKEASIIAEAGRVGAVTVATNMAGRGVDIILGGSEPADPKFAVGEKMKANDYKKKLVSWQKVHDEVVALGGLHVIGTERHESRRIDNQLRGRAGRQGDPGSSRFFLSLDDDLMRIFGGEQVAKVMSFLKLPDDQPIEHGMVSKSIEQAQVKVEGFNFDARKHLVEYDDVANKQREVIYKTRKRVLGSSSQGGESLKEEIKLKIGNEIENLISLYTPGSITPDEADRVVKQFIEIIPFDDLSQKAMAQELAATSDQDKPSFLKKIVEDTYENRESTVGEGVMREVEKFAYLSAIDKLWMDHLDALDDLREGIGLRGYGQKEPLVEYKNEAFGMFERLMAQIDYEVVRRVFRIQVGATPPSTATASREIMQRSQENIDMIDSTGLATTTVPSPKTEENKTKEDNTGFLGALKNIGKKKDTKSVGDMAQALKALGGTKITEAAKNIGKSGNTPSKNPHKNLGRNDPCWCGSGKKYKKCHYPN